MVLCFHSVRNSHLFHEAVLCERLVIFFTGLAAHCTLNGTEKDASKTKIIGNFIAAVLFLIAAFLSKAPAISFLPGFCPVVSFGELPGYKASSDLWSGSSDSVHDRNPWILLFFFHQDRLYGWISVGKHFYVSERSEVKVL